MENKILIIGAGYAGVLTAKKLAKKFKKDSNVTITIIDKNPFHTMLTELHEVAACRVEEESIKISLNKIFAGRKVEVVLDNVASIDFDSKTVTGKEKTYTYDYLVIAAGSKPTYFGIPGVEEYSYKLWSYDDAIVLRDRIHSCFRQAACETDIEEKKRLLNFYIVGAGFTGVEMAGELAEYVPILCDKYEIPRELVTIYNVDALSRPVPILPEKLSAKIKRRLEKMGITVILDSGVCALGEKYIEVKREGRCDRHEAGTVIWTAGIEAADITNHAAETLKSSGRGRIEVDKYLRALDNESVYVAGDNMMYIPEGESQPVPQMVENCEHSADTVAKNITSAIRNTGKMEEYKPSFHGVMVCVGGRYGAARVGLPNFMLNLPSFLAMLSKHFINVIYFIQVLGWNKIFSYVKHEFFTIRNDRSFLGGHFSNKTPSFLMVPLRIWLGGVWIFEGILKILEGWFKEPKLEAFFGGASAWYDSILNAGAKAVTDAASAATGAAASAADAVSAATGAAASAADAVSAATGAAASAADAVSAATGAAASAADAVSAATGAADAVVSAGTKIFDINFLGLFHAIFVSGKGLEVSKISDYAFKLDVPLMNWFVDKFILPNNSVQLFMQGFIVISEILIGLALMGGLFTTPAAAFSLILQFMFVCTTGLYLGTFWMVFAGIAVLIGAGRTLGLDYYAMPWLKKKWRKVPFIRKWYIYND